MVSPSHQNQKLLTETKTENFQNQVYRLVRGVPKGKVATYGQIANLIHLRGESSRHLEGGSVRRQTGFGARAVGNALHLNKSADVPCHRVVDRNGRIAPNFGFGGAAQQRRRLEAEGVKFRDEMHVDLPQSLWRGNR